MQQLGNMHEFLIENTIFWQNAEPRLGISQTTFTSGFIFAFMTLRHTYLYLFISDSDAMAPNVYIRW